MPSPRPIPTALKVVRGNPGKRPLNPDEPKPEIKAPSCPRHLDAEARKEWRRISKVLVRLGLLSAIDRSALAGYCQSWSRWVQAEKEVRARGHVVKTANGNQIQNPHLAIANKAMDRMLKFLIEFGMTPASRTKVSSSKK